MKLAHSIFYITFTSKIKPDICKVDHKEILLKNNLHKTFYYPMEEMAAWCPTQLL